MFSNVLVPVGGNGPVANSDILFYDAVYCSANRRFTGLRY